MLPVEIGHEHIVVAGRISAARVGEVGIVIVAGETGVGSVRVGSGNGGVVEG